MSQTHETTKQELIERMGFLVEKAQRALETCQKGEKHGLTFQDIAWLAWGVSNEAAEIQFPASSMAVKHEGCKDRF